jgi:hypothetical protein
MDQINNESVFRRRRRVIERERKDFLEGKEKEKERDKLNGKEKSDA